MSNSLISFATESEMAPGTLQQFDTTVVHKHSPDNLSLLTAYEYVK